MPEGPVQRVKRVTKAFYSLDMPFDITAWPEVVEGDAIAILNLLLSVIEPIGSYRRIHKVPSKGRRIRRRKLSSTKDPASRTAVDEHLACPPPPDIAREITIGFNSTIRGLQGRASSNAESCAVTEQLAQSECDHPERSDHGLSAIFVDKNSVPSVVLERLPSLIYTNNLRNPRSKQTFLVALPRNSEPQLRKTMNIPHAGIIGVKHDALGAHELLCYVKDHIKHVEFAHFSNIGDGKYLPAIVSARNVETKSKTQVKRD